MKHDHEIDPEFEKHLEWQLRTAFRRKGRFARPVRDARRVLGTAALVMLSFTLGAAGALGADRLQSSNRRELLLARSEIRVQMTAAQLERAEAEAARAEKLAASGVVSEAVVVGAREALLDARTERALRELDYEEVFATGEEPREDLGAPKVAGRDFVLERLQLALETERFRHKGAAQELERTRALHAKGVVSERELAYAALAYGDVGEGLAELERRVEIRLSFLDGMIPPQQIDLVVMREAARSRLRRLQRQLSVVEAEQGADAARQLEGLGYIGESRRESEIVRRELELAEIELKLIQDRLGVSAWEPAPRPEEPDALPPVGYDRR